MTFDPDDTGTPMDTLPKATKNTRTAPQPKPDDQIRIDPREVPQGRWATCVACPYCKQQPGSMCVVAKGRQKGKTSSSCHRERRRLAIIYRKNQRQDVIGEWFSETQFSHLRTCMRCGCLVFNSRHARQAHLDWHQRLDGLGIA